MLRSLIAALVLRAIAPAREMRSPRVTSTITDGRISPERREKLIEDGRKAVDDLVARSRVERTGHFDAPRFGA